MIGAILSVGDELVLGQTVDTNSAWISRKLAEAGVEVVAHVCVGDDQAAIERAIRELAGRGELLVVSGGIGPTPDDLTRQALAGAMGVEMRIDENWLAKLREIWTRRAMTMPQMNRIQAMAPLGAKLLENPWGTASGVEAALGRCRVVVLPGVPREMMQMFERHVMPGLGGGAAIVSRALHTFGLGESAVAEKLGDLMDRRRNPSVGTTVAGGIVSLRINARGGPAEEPRRMLEETARLCEARLGDLIFGTDDENLPGVVARLLKRAGPNFWVATAESCTGGLLAGMLTEVAGSSEYFRQGWVTYANDAKQRLLGVPPEMIEENGAVSEAVAAAMARGALERAGADVALAVTGIAGPGGGSADKPVGTVWIGLAAKGGASRARRFALTGDRAAIRDRSAKMALTLLRYHLLGRETPF